MTGLLYPWQLLRSSLCLQPSSASFCYQTWITFNRIFFSLQITKYSSIFIPGTTSESKALNVLSLCQVFTPLMLSASLTSPFHWLQQAFYLLVMISDAAWTVTSIIRRIFPLQVAVCLYTMYSMHTLKHCPSHKKIPTPKLGIEMKNNHEKQRGGIFRICEWEKWSDFHTKNVLTLEMLLVSLYVSENGLLLPNGSWVYFICNAYKLCYSGASLCLSGCKSFTWLSAVQRRYVQQKNMTEPMPCL